MVLPLPASDPDERRLHVVVSDADVGRLEDLARASGLSVGAYLRAAGLGELPVDPEEQEVVRQVEAAIGRMNATVDDLLAQLARTEARIAEIERGQA